VGKNVPESVIAVKVADGSYYPVLLLPEHKHRKLVLTTVRDRQQSMKIDLFRGSSEQMSDAEYVGSLFFEKISVGPKGSPDIELELGFDSTGNLAATATDRATGNMESLAVSVDSAPDLFESPDFSIDEDQPVPAQTKPVKPQKEKRSFAPSLALVLAGIFLLVLLIVLCLLFAFRVISLPVIGGKPVPAVTETPVKAEPTPEAVKTEPETKTVNPPATKVGPLSHLVIRGDTLWDLSVFYYRTPWAWNVIYAANQDRIKNPNIIYPGITLVIPAE
jgi:hypothetical protein